MYCIYQIDENDNEIIINIIDCKTEFWENIIDINKEKKPQIIKDKTYEQIRTDKDFSFGYYLLINENQDRIDLIEKFKYEAKGVFYSEFYIDIRYHYTWTLIPLKSSSLVNKILNKTASNTIHGIIPNTIFDSFKNDSFKNDKLDIHNIIFHDIQKHSEMKMRNSNINFNDSETIDDNVTQEILDDRLTKQKLDDNSCDDFDIINYEVLKCDLSTFVEPKYSVHNSDFNIDNNMNNNWTKNILEINRFNLDDMCKYPICNIIAKRGSGRTWTIMNIIKHLISNSKVLVFCGVKDDKEIYESIPNVTFVHGYDSNILNEQILKNENSSEDHNMIVVFDDINHKNDSILFDFLQSSKRHKITVIFSQRFPWNYNIEFDYTIILEEDFIPNQKKIYELYANIFATFDTFKKCFNILTEDYGAMVISNAKNNVNHDGHHKINDLIFWYEAVYPNTL